MPLDVRECFKSVAELERAQHRDVYIRACDVVADTEAAAVSVVEEPHLSLPAANASTIARKVMPEPAKAPAKNTASVLIVLPPLCAESAVQVSTRRTYPLPLLQTNTAFEAPL